MAKKSSQVEVKKGKGGKSDGYAEDAKSGPMRKGKMIDGEFVPDAELPLAEEDDDDEEEDEDEDREDQDDDDEEDSDDDEDLDEDDEEDEPAPPPKKKKHNVVIEGGKVTKNEVVTNQTGKKKKVEVDMKLKPSQRPVLPAEKRKVAEEKITKKSVIVTVKDLETEYEMDGKKIRRIIRALGFKAPDTDGEEGTFGAKKKYEWDSKSPHLKAIKAALDEESEG